MTHCRELSNRDWRRGAYVFGRLATFLFWLLQGFCCLCLCFCLRCASQITSNQSCDTFFHFSLLLLLQLQLLRPKIKANWPPPLYFFILSIYISSAHPILKSRLFYDPFILHYHWDTWLQSIGFYFYLNFRGRTQIGPLGHSTTAVAGESDIVSSLSASAKQVVEFMAKR